MVCTLLCSGVPSAIGRVAVVGKKVTGKERGSKMPQEVEVTTARENIGEVVVERIPEGMRLFVKCGPWASIINNRETVYASHKVCGDISAGKPIAAKPENVGGLWRESYPIFYDNKVNLTPLLAKGLENGLEFKFPGVWNTETLKKIAQGYKEFLVSSYNDFARPVKIEYRITSE